MGVSSADMFRSLKIAAILTAGLSLLGLSGCMASWSSHDQPEKLTAGQPLTLYVATDIHYLSPRLHDDGEAFHTYIQAGDGKQLSYIDPMSEAFAEEVKAKNPAALILSGDLTNNGEKASHEDLAAKLKKIEAAGTQVYVIPGNHDLSNPWARRFKGDSQYKTEAITPEQFVEIYGAFGYHEAITRDTSTLSYLAKVSPDLWLLMLDTSQYDLNEFAGFPQTDGEIPPATQEWIQKCTRLASENGARIVTVMHHNLVDHSTVPIKGFTLNNSKEINHLFEKLRLNLVLSGHIHIQDIRQTNHGLYDIATSAFSVYPHQYGVLQYDPTGRTIEYESTQVDVEAWARKRQVSDGNLTGFAEYSRKFFAEHSYNKAYASLGELPLSEADKTLMARTMSDINLLYFAGRAASGPERERLLASQGYRLWEKADSTFLQGYVQSMLEPKSPYNTKLQMTLQGGLE
ncbi:metallophosphoesterase [Paenibacillus sp. FSL R7-0216]|uniref:metallophosphoesterase n=1 Tax=Paenibacillus sp. FSL R7-0216 TaxID=2921677 RepID=UPI0030D86B07